MAIAVSRDDIFCGINKFPPHPPLQDTYWSYLLQRPENEGLLGIAAVGYFFWCPVRSFMYDGAMIQSPSREALARARLSGSPEQFVEVLTQVTTIVASFMVGCHMPVKIKTLALPELWDTICGLKAGRTADKKLLQAKVFIFFFICASVGLD